MTNVMNDSEKRLTISSLEQFFAHNRYYEDVAGLIRTPDL
jgi:hypothetical protein